jgi:hypothetical protein
MSARRHHLSGLLPLEVWDVLIDDTPVYLLPQADQPQAVAELVCLLRGGRARRLRADSALPQLSIDRVVLAGGGPLARTRLAMRERGIEAELADEPLWIAEAGGRALLSTLCDPALGAVLDVGQTSLKLCFGGHRKRLPRPLGQVPLELHARDPLCQPGFRANTVAFIAGALLHQPPPRALVLALPCEIADDLSVAGCSYPWLAGDPTLVGDILAAAELSHVPCLLLNDAELAAYSVSLTRPPGAATLVLTLGLGVGSAYLPSD